MYVLLTMVSVSRSSSTSESSTAGASTLGSSWPIDVNKYIYRMSFEFLFTGWFRQWFVFRTIEVWLLEVWFHRLTILWWCGVVYVCIFPSYLCFSLLYTMEWLYCFLWVSFSFIMSCFGVIVFDEGMDSTLPLNLLPIRSWAGLHPLGCRGMFQMISSPSLMPCFVLICFLIMVLVTLTAASARLFDLGWAWGSMLNTPSCYKFTE